TLLRVRKVSGLKYLKSDPYKSHNHATTSRSASSHLLVDVNKHLGSPEVRLTDCFARDLKSLAVVYTQ
ncbi:MAG: hypothetical protein ABI151_17165, partial [Chitinophagaceae bacterium]